VRRDLEAASPIMPSTRRRLENSSTLGIESVLNRCQSSCPQRHAVQLRIQTGATASLASLSVNCAGIGPNRTSCSSTEARAAANAALVIRHQHDPSAAIERIETITGGASAVYGPPDAFGRRR